MTAVARAAPPASIAWRRVLGYALLWGFAFGALEAVVMRLADLSSREFLVFTLTSALPWLMSSIGIACLAMVAEPRMSSTWLALATMTFALTIAAASVGVTRMTSEDSRSLSAHFAYNAWHCLFYGGLFMLVCVLVMRAERTRRVLGHAEIARSHTDTVLSEARLQALRGHVDPVLLLRAMGEVQRRYSDDAASAERLLDQLANFLRSAMPGVRSGRSTVAAELALVQNYVSLWAELDPRRAGWRIAIDVPVPDLPFPPLLLLPVLDQVSGGCLNVRREADRITLSIDGPIEAGWLPSPLAYRLHVGLRATCGESWTLGISDAASSDTPALVLSLPIEGQALRHAARGHVIPDTKRPSVEDSRGNDAATLRQQRREATP